MQTVAELVQSVLEGHNVSSELDVLAGDCLVRVRTNSPQLRAQLADYFRIWLPEKREEGRTPDIVVTALETDVPSLAVPFADWERDAGKVGRKEEFVDLPGGRAVRKVRTGMQYLIGGNQRLVFGASIRNSNQVVNFVVAQVINFLMHGGKVLCHAAAVVHAGQGLAIAGVSGAGKSTLALRLVSEGLSFTSNDRVLVGRSPSADGHRMGGVPKQPRINPGTALSIPELSALLSPERREALRALPERELWDLEEKVDVDVAGLFGAERILLAAPLSAFLVLRWSRAETAPTRFQQVVLRERPDVLSAIMKPPGPFFEPKDGSPPRGAHRAVPEDYLKALEGLPVFEATGKLDFEAAVRFSMNLLQKSGTAV